MASAATQDLASKAQAYYDERLRSDMEKTHRDWYLAIDPDSGEYYLGRTLSEAAWAAYDANPKRQTYIIRIGHKTTVEVGNSPA